MSDSIKKVVLAYSGGLDTSVILKWLIETYNCEVVAFSANIGQGDEVSEIKVNALNTGASKVYIDDLQEIFVKDYVFPAFRANAIYEGKYLLGTSLARPLIAKRQMEIAEIEGADAGRGVFFREDRGLTGLEVDARLLEGGPDHVAARTR